MASDSTDPVVVVGGGLAGMAAAARLAKAGHPVQLFEARGQLGGRWAAAPLADLPGLRVDAMPNVIGFPAPWRDLFRKSGRPFEAELGRTGHALVPAGSARLVFADATKLTLPTDRGEQFATLSQAYGLATATRWRDLLDHLDEVWQAIRPLGLESQLRGRHQLSAATTALLRPRQTLEQLATGFDHPHLSALIRSVAYRLGSLPQHTPGWCAVELSVIRRFGRWTVRSDYDAGDTGRTSVLVEALAERLRLRRVDVQLGRAVTQIVVDGGRATGVRTADGQDVRAVAVVSTADHWHTVDELLPRQALRRERRSGRRLNPALAPRVTHDWAGDASPAVTETVRLTAAGVPTVTYTRPAAGGTLTSIHDFAAAHAERAYGAQWRGYRSWFRRPPVSTSVDALFLAGPASAGGNGLSTVILTGALASYAAYDRLG